MGWGDRVSKQNIKNRGTVVSSPEDEEYFGGIHATSSSKYSEGNILTEWAMKTRRKMRGKESRLNLIIEVLHLIVWSIQQKC